MRTRQIIGLIVLGCIIASIVVLGGLIAWLGGTFRNPAARTPKVKWPVSEPDALDLWGRSL